MTFVINPGTGAIESANGEPVAVATLAALLADASLSHVTVKSLGQAGDGRYRYRLRRWHSDGYAECYVDVPPLPVDEIRRSRIRFYVDGDSWIWEIAANVVRDVLYMERDEVLHGV